MGKTEVEAKRKARKGELQKIVLETVKISGLVGLALIAPNVIGALAKLGIIKSPRQTELVERSCKRLVKGGYLLWQDGKLRLTPKGESELRKLTVRQISIKPHRWDKRWRVLIFDIPEYRRSTRNKVRETLRAIGFVRLQDSVWAYPYDCEDLITLLKADFKVGKDMLYLVVEAIESDAAIKRHFGIH